ncbi:MAG: hypothetical protein HIU91_04780 [Acidobacteria bacterium]|nr:hypothetical protein [Acidobacteriota bacterium]
MRDLHTEHGNGSSRPTGRLMTGHSKVPPQSVDNRNMQYDFLLALATVAVLLSPCVLELWAYRSHKRR